METLTQDKLAEKLLGIKMPNKCLFANVTFEKSAFSSALKKAIQESLSDF